MAGIHKVCRVVKRGGVCTKKGWNLDAVKKNVV